MCEAFYFTKATVETRDITDAPFEAHKKYIDIFIPLTGREIVKTADIGSLTETYPYQDADDFYLFEGPAQVNAVKRLLLRCGWNKKLYQPETPMCGSITPIQAPAREGDAQPRTNKKAPLCKGSWLREAETEGL